MCWKDLNDFTRFSIMLAGILGILSSTLSSEMHTALFRGFQKKINNSIGELVNYDRLFHDLIVKSCRDRLLENNFVREELNINIIEALEKEAMYNGQSANRYDYIKGRLAELIDAVCPWTPKSEDSSDINLWGISSNCRTAIESGDDKSMLEKLIEEVSIGKLEANNVVSHPELFDNSIYFVSCF